MKGAQGVRTKRLLRVVTALLLLGLAAALVYVGAYGYTTWRTDARTDELAVQVAQRRGSATATPLPAAGTEPTASGLPDACAPAETTQPSAQATAAVPTALPTESAIATEPLQSLSTDAPDADPLLAYYRTLAQENPDMAGWISIADTPVDYPVMHTPEQPQYYLYRDFDRNRTLEGIPFLDGRCDPDAPSDNLIIYGHNMRSQRMFGSLHRYREEEYRAAHPLISFDTLEERRVYRVYAGFVVKLEGRLEAESMLCYRVQLTSDGEQLQALLDYVARHALFINPEAEPKVNSQLLTLSTCNGGGKPERFVVLAVRVQ